METKYYIGHAVYKGSGDYPACPHKVYFTASSKEEYNVEYKKAINCCEDWEIKETTKEVYTKFAK